MQKDNFEVLEKVAAKKGWELTQDKDGICMANGKEMFCFDHTEDDYYRLCSFLQSGVHPMLVDME